MITAKKRMVPPEAAQDSRLLPLAKRAVFIAMHQVAEDSGCLLWDARDIHAVAFPIDPEHTLEDVERFMGSSKPTSACGATTSTALRVRTCRASRRGKAHSRA